MSIRNCRKYLQGLSLAALLFMGYKVQAAETLSIPKLSDVAFSSRWFYPQAVGGHDSTYDAMKAFHASRMMWLYIDAKSAQDRGFIKTLNEKGIPSQATINPAFLFFPKDLVGDLNLLGIKLDVNHQPMAISKNMYFGCPSSPIFKDKFYQRIEDAVSFPVESLQFDDWSFNNIVLRSPKAAVQKCYCNFCLSNFQQWLMKKTDAELAQAGVKDPAHFDYRLYVLQQEMNPNNTVPTLAIENWYNDSIRSTLDKFWKQTYTDIQQMAGRTLAISSNAYAGSFTPITGPFNFALAEIRSPYTDPQPIFDQVQYNVKTLKRRTVYTSANSDTAMTRKIITWVTASGGVHLVPWDVYMVNGPRYYGRPQDYADLYGFIRANEQHLDGYESFAVAGWHLNSTANTGSLEVLNSKTVSAYLRVKTDSMLSSRVIVHVVDSSEQPAGCTLKIKQVPGMDPTQFQYTLATPKAYNKALHDEVELSQDFTRLVKYEVLMPRIQSGYIYLDVPAVKPWGMLIIH